MYNGLFEFAVSTLYAPDDDITFLLPLNRGGRTPPPSRRRFGVNTRTQIVR